MLEAAALDRAEEWLNAQRIEWERRFDRLGRYLDTLQTEGGEMTPTTDAKAAAVRGDSRSNAH